MQFVSDSRRFGTATNAHEEGMMTMDVELDSHLQRELDFKERGVEQVGARAHTRACF